jgi:hypothetical protein
MNENCHICRGIGWVCERHPDNRPYDCEKGCTCGYEAPCACNDSDPSDTNRVTGIEEEMVR